MVQIDISHLWAPRGPLLWSMLYHAFLFSFMCLALAIFPLIAVRSFISWVARLAVGAPLHEILGMDRTTFDFQSIVALAIICCVVGVPMGVREALNVSQSLIPHYNISFGKLGAALRAPLVWRRAGAFRAFVWGIASLFAATVLGVAVYLLVTQWPRSDIFVFAVAGYAISLSGICACLSPLLALNSIRLLVLKTSAIRFFAASTLAAIAFITPVVGGILFERVLLSLDGHISQQDGVVTFVFTLVTIVIAWWAGAAVVLRLIHSTADGARRSDTREPILFLRAFGDDATAFIDTGAGHSERFERAMVTVAQPYGPVVAIGEPNAPRLRGAARAYFRDADWRGAVSQWLDQAGAVLMLAGLTDGVRWELDAAIAKGHAQKLIIMFPPNSHDIAARWAWVKRAFLGAPIAEEMDAVNPTRVLAMHVNSEGRLVTLVSDLRFARNYKAAFEVALFGIVERRPLR